MNKLLIIILSVSLFTACRYKTGSGNVITEKRSTGIFTGISVGGGFDVEVKSGPTEVVVEADDNIMKYIETGVENGILKINLDNISINDVHLKVYITAPEINNISASASADIQVKDILKAKSIKLHSSSGANIKAALDAPEVSANASSGGDMDISGRTKDFDAVSSSGSTIDAKELLSENVKANASSGAKINAYASVSIDGNASSGGNVSYSGGAITIRKSESSGGSVEKD